MFESSNLSRDCLSREIGHKSGPRQALGRGRHGRRVLARERGAGAPLSGRLSRVGTPEFEWSDSCQNEKGGFGKGG